MGKFKSVEDLQEARQELSESYEEGLPNYLTDYFDDEELKLKKKEFFTELRESRKSKSWDELNENKREQEEEFFKENEFRLVKTPSTSKYTVNDYPEPQRAEERIDDERDLTDEERKVLLHICKEDLYLFAVRYFPHYLKKPSSKLHRFLYKTISRDLGKYNDGVKWAIAAPRGNAKSSLVSNILPIWCLCYDKKKFILMISDTLGQSTDFLSDVKRELEFNAKLNRDFPQVCGKGPVWRQEEIITNNQIRIMALGTGSKVRGRKYGVYRPDLLIFDDLENGEMVRSVTQREHIREDWFDKEVIFSDGEEKAKADFFVVGTIIGKDALLNALLDATQYPEWKSMRFKAVEQFSTSGLWDDWAVILKNRLDLERKETAKKFFEEHKEEMLEGTKVLWPEGDPYYNLMVWKTSNPSGFMTEKQNHGVDLTKVYIQLEQLHFENFKSIGLQNMLSYCVVYGAIDPSLGKKSRKGDYSAIITVGRERKTGYIYVLDIDVKRRSVDDQIDEILKKHQKYKYKLFAVETNAFQYVVAENLRKRSREVGGYVPVHEVIQTQDKKLRFEGIVPLLTDGTIVFDSFKHTNNNMYNLGVDQIVTFTGEGDSHDDAPDALVMAVEIAKTPKFRMLTKG